MKPGYKTQIGDGTMSFKDEHYDCVVQSNRPYNNTIQYWPLIMNRLHKAINQDDIGVWIPKGTKRPQNWPVKTKRNNDN